MMGLLSIVAPMNWEDMDAVPRLSRHCHLSAAGKRTDVVSREDLVMETLGAQPDVDLEREPL